MGPLSDGPQFSPPPGVRAYVVGDIHGRADLLGALMQQIVEDSMDHADGRKYLVFLGDYVDRGPESRRVIELLSGQPPLGFEVVCLRGNHDWLLLTFLYNESVGQLWLANGGAATLASYGVTPTPGLTGQALVRDIQMRLQNAMPMEHVLFLSTLEPCLILGDYFFCHAGVKPGIPLGRQQEVDLINIRDEFLESTDWHGKMVVHGHSIARVPVIRRNRIGIDTGAFRTGRLTSLVLEGAERRVLSTG